MIGIETLRTLLPTLFRPLVRLCVRHGIRIGDVEEVLKILFVSEAKRNIVESKGEFSVSRVAAMTGIQRPAVTELLGKDIPAKRTQSLMMKILGAWQSKRAFTTAYGRPRVLSIEGKDSEFASLVRSVSQDLNPYTILFELERNKLIEKTSTGARLLSSSFAVRQDVGEGLKYLASDLSDLLEAVESNLVGAGPPHHHLTTEYDSIPISKIPSVQKAVLKEGEKLHGRIRKILAAADSDLNGKGKDSDPVRVAFCSFGFVDLKHRGRIED